MFIEKNQLTYENTELYYSTYTSPVEMLEDFPVNLLTFAHLCASVFLNQRTFSLKKFRGIKNNNNFSAVST